MLIKGSNLSPKQVQLVLAAYVHRTTVEHKGVNICHYELTDAQWLREHAFHFTKDGSRLSTKHKHAEPQWMADEVAK